MFDAESEFVRERIYHLNVLDDGTVVLLGRLRGDLDRARALLEDRSDVLGYSLSGEEANAALVFVHSRPPEALGRFVHLPRSHEVFFDFPIEGLPDGRIRVVMLGETNEVLRRALDDVPDELGLDVERLGPYLEGPEGVAGVLTERQREVLRVAHDVGYYEVPRRATHRDVADRLDLSVGTVGEHLQKIEARVLGDLAARTTDGRGRT
jgi:hypothetical protein